VTTLKASWWVRRNTRSGDWTPCDALFAQFGDEETFSIYPYTENNFFCTDVPAFIASAGGKASALVLHQNGQDRTAYRVPDVEESNDMLSIPIFHFPHSCGRLGERVAL